MIAAAAGTLLAAAILGGVAYATIPSDTNVFTACMLKNVGTIPLIDPSLSSSSLLSHCASLEAQLSWNQKGQPSAAGLPGPAGTAGPAGPAGKDGAGVNGSAEAAGANCDAGGVQLATANGVTYVCDGKNGRDGKDGTNGTNGREGKDGVSVTSAAEPAGTNCANGGSKFTAANNNVTYACDGSGGTGGIGSLDAPRGSPCNNGAGTTEITYGSNGSVSLTCGAQTRHALTVTLNSISGGSGTVTSSPVGISCSGTCTATFSAGTNVTLTATPAA